MAGLLFSSTTQAVKESSVADSDNQGLIDQALAALPGTYSNFAQVVENNQDSPVTDLNIRRLNNEGEPVLLFASQQRDSDLVRYDVYWLKLNEQSKQTELYFSRLTGSELSLSMQATLALAWQRVIPGCVMVLSSDEDRISGQTQPETCRFENPLEGETRLYRRLSLEKDLLEMETSVMLPGEQHTAGSGKLEMQKHREYQGQISVRADKDMADSDTAEWRSSIRFNTRDDGRTIQLYDGDMKTLPFGIQLARLHWREGEPRFLKLSVINMESGAIQAYQWFDPGSGQLTMNLEWITLGLEPSKPGESGQ